MVKSQVSLRQHQQCGESRVRSNIRNSLPVYHMYSLPITKTIVKAIDWWSVRRFSQRAGRSVLAITTHSLDTMARWMYVSADPGAQTTSCRPCIIARDKVTLAWLEGELLGIKDLATQNH